jgi:hypothetical protein
MSRAFHYFRKRKIRTRFVGLWLCLVAIELFCPIFCDEPAAVAANLRSSETEISSVVRTSSDATSASVEQSAASTDDQSAYCDDECLCHAAAIPCVVVGTKPSAIRSEPMMIGYANAFSSSLPPPYLPPKFS